MIAVTPTFRVEQGSVLNVGEVAYVGMQVTNNFPWDIKRIKFVLSSVGPGAHVEPAGQIPRKIDGPDIAPGGTAVQEFTIKADAVGICTASLKLEWVLDDTNLTYSIEPPISFTILAE